MNKDDLKNMAIISIPSIILLLIGLVVIKPVGGFWGYVSGVLYIATAINQRMGLNIWLARIIAAPFFVFGYYYGIRYIFFTRKHRGTGYLALILVWSVICASMFATQGSFSRETGEALKYYFRDDRGQVVLREHSGVDADTGAELHLVTPEIMKEYRLEQEGVLSVTENTLFDPDTGQPMKRYYRAQDGAITLFPPEVEFHPQFGEQLKMITPDIARIYAQQQGLSPGSRQEQTSANTMTSAEEIQQLNQAYQQRVHDRLDATHQEHEHKSQKNFNESLEE